MAKIFSKNPSDIVAEILEAIPNKRTRVIVAKRYGLSGKPVRTLESIGGEYGITRERVRQIEEDGLKHLRKPAAISVLKPFFASLDGHFGEHGNVMKEDHLLHSLDEEKNHNAIILMLTLGKAYSRASETPILHHRWATGKNHLAGAQKFLAQLVSAMGQKNQAMTKGEFYSFAKNEAAKFVAAPTEKVVASYLNISKEIGQNSFNQYGLVSWPEINPRGMKDKAFLVLKRTRKPLHFREVAEYINKFNFDGKTAYHQTVHNELIKDSRFVLIGRGIYALSEWGYKPGVVREVLVEVLKNSGRPLSFAEVKKEIAKQRVVKDNTVLLNLQNKGHFKKVEGKYALA